MSDGLQSCASCAEAARERDEARAERDKEKRIRTLAVDRYHLINEAMLQAHERVDRIAEAIGCPVHNQDGDDIDREVVVEAARTLARDRDEARAEVARLREALAAAVPQRMANQSCVEGREVVDADWLLENWSALRDDEELLCTVGGVRRWLGVVLCDALTRPADAAAAPE